MGYVGLTPSILHDELSIVSPELISVRKQLKKTQLAFSRLLGIPVATIRDWEQGRKQPDSAAVTLLKVAQKHPEALEDIAA